MSFLRRTKSWIRISQRKTSRVSRGLPKGRKTVPDSPRYEPLESRQLLAGIVLVALCSGCASLIYQINWQRQLTTIFGLAHYATTLTILVFFVGFAAGAYLAKRYADQVRHVLILIVALELIIGLFGATSYFAFDAARSLNGVMSIALADARGVLLSLRAILCLLLLLVPTVCMGATLPCFYKACIQSRDTRGSRVGWITGANTLGALVGSMGTTWLLMGQLTGQTQVFIAAAFNLLGAGIAVCLLKFRFSAQAPGPESPRVQKAAVEPLPTSLMYAFMLSGAASLGLEIVWNRLAYMSLEHTVFTFALVLSVYLASYTAGVFLAGLWLRRHPARRGIAAGLQLLALISTLAGFKLFGMGLHHEMIPGDAGYQVSAVVVVSAYVFLPMFFMGLAMPMVVQLLSGNPESLGRDTSRALMMNNIGSIAAILIVGFILIPFANLQLVMLFCSLLLVGAAVLTAGWPQDGRQLRLRYPAAALLVVLLFWLHPRAPYDSRHVARYDSLPLWSAEDEAGYWAVYREGTLREGAYYLYLNDNYENFLSIPARATIEGDFLLGPMVKPEIRSAYSIGLGLALEPYELLRFAEVERFVTAEISPAAVSLARRAWGGLGGGPFDDPRFEIVLEDGRLWLEHQPETFDLIYSGTNRCYNPGSTNLYSADYFAMLKGKLNAGGLVQQWIPRLPEHQSIAMVKTFLAVFPDALILEYEHPGQRANYWWMLGFRDGTPADLAMQVRAAFRRAPEIFRTSSVPGPGSFMNRLLIPRRKAIEALDLPLINDDLPVVEFDRPFSDAARWDELDEIGQAYSEAGLAEYLKHPRSPCVGN